jgi:uncharacterized Fe-S cluster-containing radical SAM superfamily enzyme
MVDDNDVGTTLMGLLERGSILVYVDKSSICRMIG